MSDEKKEEKKKDKIPPPNKKDLIPVYLAKDGEEKEENEE